ncbi:MAG: hypothetical protein GY754_37805 [bacterium]|nr:hypothetical protein [bacterium]
MSRKFKIIIILSFAVSILAAVDLLRPSPIDWSHSFSKKDTIRYGNYILFDLLPVLFPNKNITAQYDSPYDSFSGKKIFQKNLIIINKTFRPGDRETSELFGFVYAGNELFIAAHEIGGGFAHNLGIEISIAPPRRTAGYYVSSYNKEGAVVLGSDENGNANFIKISYGKGHVYVNTVLLAFTNYNLLREKNYEYVFKSLSYLPEQDTLWDEFYKPGRAAAATPLRYILSKKGLQWSHYTLLCGLVLFVVFGGRRRQRVIPIIEPLKNTTLEFIETVGRLYFRRGDHKNIAEKKIVYFLDHIHSRYYIDALHVDSDLYANLAAKSGMSESDMEQLFEYITTIRNSPAVSSKQLFELNKRIENFWAQQIHGAGQ